MAFMLKPLAATAVTAGTPVTLWTPATGKAYRILGYAVSLSVAGEVIFKNSHAGTATEVFRTPALAAGTGIAGTLAAGFVPGAPNDLLQVDVSASGTVNGYVYGTEY
ncbi:MAG TPA: hypothetical protein VFA70_04280 [Dehalococcoidia bacterium]|nr:hypothetical protein [Dehalococcoidia bacterium]